MAYQIIDTTVISARALLFWHPNMESLAKSILNNFSHVVEPGEVTWGHFDDEWPNIFFGSRRQLEHRHVIFLASMNHPSVVVEQHAFMLALSRQRLRSFHIIVPYFGNGTFERVDVENKVATAEPFFKLLTSSMPPITGGTSTMTIFDPHALTTRFYAADTITVVQQSAFKFALDYAIVNKATVVFPDEGALKRYGPFFNACSVVTCSKKRGEGDKRTVCYADTPPTRGKFALIVDDLCMTGSTMAECAKLLKKDFEFVSAFAVHAIFPKNSHLFFCKGGKHEGLISNFIVTNSNPTVSDVLTKLPREVSPFIVRDIGPLIGQQIVRDVLPYVTQSNLLNKLRNTEILNYKPLKFYLASSSKVKMDALEQCLKIFFSSKGSMGTLSVPSCISEQPLSYEETLLGATNRIEGMMRELSPDQVSGHMFLVSIENGIWERDGILSDSAIVIVKRVGYFPDEVTVLSEAHPIEDAYKTFMPILKESNGATTLGKLISDSDPSKPADAWFNRHQQLYDALMGAFTVLDSYHSFYFLKRYT